MAGLIGYISALANDFFTTPVTIAITIVSSIILIQNAR